MSDGLLPGMEEGRRQAWLAALGIPLWSSRQDLPGAKPSAGLEFTAFLEAAASLPVAETAEAEVGIPAVVEAAPVFSEQGSRPIEPATPSRVVSVPAQVASTSQSSEKPTTSNPDHPRFACRVELLAPGWLGVIALDDAPDLSAQEYRLLGNLVHALGGDGAAAGAREHFRWPLSPNPSIPRDAGAAREALAAFLGRRREATRWLVLGETLAVYVRTALPQHQVIAAPMLRELLENPAAKRSLWQALHG